MKLDSELRCVRYRLYQDDKYLFLLVERFQLKVCAEKKAPCHLSMRAPQPTTESAKW